MAIKKIGKIKYKKMEELCFEAIKNNGIIFLDEIYIYTDLVHSVFPLSEMEKSVRLKDEIDVNRAKLKRDLRIKWSESTNATLNAALYKLICTEEERRALSSAASAKNSSGNDVCTQEDYLKSLREMGVEENCD